MFKSLAPTTAVVVLALILGSLTGQVSLANQFVQSRPRQAIRVEHTCDFYQLPVFNLDTFSGAPVFMNLSMDAVSRLQNFTSWTLTSWNIYNASCFMVYYNKSLTANVTNLVFDNNLNAPYALVLTFKLYNGPNGGSPGPDTYSYVYPVVANRSVSANQAISDILNWTQTYSNANGTLGYFEGPGQFVAIVRQVMGFTTAFTSATNCTTLNDFTMTNLTVYRFNCVWDINPLLNDYNYVTVTHSFPFWLLVLTLLSFIVFTNYLDEDVEFNDATRTSIWMNHPVYAIAAVAEYQVYPRRPRVAIVYFVCAAIFWFNCIVIFKYQDTFGRSTLSLVARLVGIAAASAAFGLIFEFIIGLVLLFYYKNTRRFANVYTNSTDYEEKKHLLEHFEERNFQATHIFYFFLIIVGLFFLITPIHFLYALGTDDQAWWLLQAVIGIAWKYLVFDMVLMALATTACGRWTVWMRGFAFDYDTYLKWESIRKFI